MWAGYELWNERLRCLAPGWKLRRADDPGIVITDYGVSVSRMKRRALSSGPISVGQFWYLVFQRCCSRDPPAARLALDRNVAAHHLAEAFADREPKTGAAVFAGGGSIGLGELLE